MAANNLQPMPFFQPKSDLTNTGARWTQWIERFNTYLVALNIKDDAQQLALLLYQAGTDVHEIFKTLPTGEKDGFKEAVVALSNYFEPEKNKIFQTYTFRKATQQPTETIDEFHTRLRGLAKFCEFHNVDFEIKMQIVCHGTSSRLRKRALKDQKYTLTDMLIDGRKAETSTAQASSMDEQLKECQINEVTSKRKCYFCGFDYPHVDRQCPAKNSTCTKCGIAGHFSKVCRRDKKYSMTPKDGKSQTRQYGKKDTAHPWKTRQHARAINPEYEESPDTSGSEDDYAYTIGGHPNKRLQTTARIQSQNITFLIDTGATVDLIDSDTYELLKNQVSLRKSSTKIYAYGAKTPLPVKGQFQATVESKERYTVSQFYVVEGRGGNLLSAKTAQDLSIIKLINTVSGMRANDNIQDQTNQKESDTEQIRETDRQVTDDRTNEVPTTSDPRIRNILDKYSTVFKGIGKLNNQKVKLHIRDNVKPVIQPQRRIPYHMRKQVSKELQKLVEQDIIEPVMDQPTPWISPIVCTPKSDGGIRLCVDMREANQAIDRERHIMPTIQDFKAEVNGSQYFSKLDLKQAYHQLELEPESRFITTFSTHEGLFQYKRLNYGTSSAAETFQNTLEQNISDIRGAKNIADDILIHGKTRKAHDEALANCLHRLQVLNLKVKGEKCRFLQKEIKFYGLIFSAEGVKPDPERIEKLVKVTIPKNASEVRSFLGMANTCHEYIQDYAQITAPLRELTKKNAVFQWKLTHQIAFDRLKKKLTQVPVMAYFDTNKRSLVIVDASPHGISAILAQRETQEQQQYKMIAYASRSLSPVEARYSQTDIEGLSLVWGIEHFRLFLIGSEFDVITDHKALEAIFNNPRSKPPARIERWMMRLQPYNFRVIYKKGVNNEADYLSRHPISQTPKEPEEERIAEEYVNFIVNNTVPKAMTVDEIKEATKNDPILTKVKQSLKTGKWDDKDPEITPYRMSAAELTIHESQEVILKGTRIVIPKALQERATQLGHVGHQGIEKTKSLLREKIWYPNMDKVVREMIEKCIACQAVGQDNPPEPMEITPTEDTPWTSLAIDFLGPIPQVDQYLLVVTDTYSKFPEVEIVNSTEARACIPMLDKIFATHGIPRKIKTDNGPPFNGQDFTKYMQILGIEWKTSTPLWPQGNAHVERFMKPLTKVLQTAKIEGRKWKQELQRFLLNYRSTPHSTTKVAPCELLFNRKVSGHLPELASNKVINKHELAKANIEKQKLANKKYYDKRHSVRESEIKVGDTVMCRQRKNNKLTPKFDPELLTVIERKYNTVIAEGNGQRRIRNASHFKKVNQDESDDEWESHYSEPVREIEGQVRPHRIRKPVARYGYNV